MSILLGILAIIGKILLLLLLLLLLILVVLLAVPIRYHVQGSYTRKVPNGLAEVLWLFGLIRLRIQSDKKPSFSFFIGGHDLLNKEEKEDKPKKKPRQNGKKEPSNTPVKQEKEKSGVSSLSAADHPVTQPAVPEKKAQESAAARRDREALENVLQSPDTAAASMPPLLPEPSDTLSDNEETSSESGLKRILQLLFSDENAGVLAKILKAVLGVIREIAPRRGHAFIRFGFDDPSLTGNLTGFLAVIYPAFRGNLEAEPVFDREVLEASGNVAGRLHLAVPVYYFIRLLLDKQVRKLISQIRKEYSDGQRNE